MDFILKVFFILFVEEILVFLPLVFLFFYSIFSFKQKKNINILQNFLIASLPFLFIYYQYSYLSNYFASIGQDSLVETDADFGEALFYIKTFISILFDPEIFKSNRYWLVLVSSLVASIFIYFFVEYYCKKKGINILSFNKFFNYFFLASLLVVLFAIFNLVKINLDVGKELKTFEAEFKKNILNFNTKRKTNKKLTVITYIGESTSALNLSLYGYPFNTSPWLKAQEKNKKFIKLNRVFATHTHSTPSLLGALSLCIKQTDKECSLPLDDIKNNLSIVDVISKTGINSYLFSTQGSLGGHNLASKTVLNTNKKFFSSQEESGEGDFKKFQGDRYVPKIKDKEFFVNNFCKENEIFENKKSSLVLLHSYAGHGLYGGYLGHAPKNLSFEYPRYINKENFLGKESRNFKLLQEYDSVIQYIDNSLQSVFECSSLQSYKNSQPMIFIYFADHGESPATARGHDSSRLTYEMLHVPFVIFFNDAAYDLYKEKFELLSRLKDKELSLKFLSDLLLFLFDIDVLDNKDNKKIVYASDKFKSLSSDFILGRKDLKGKTKKIQTFWNYKNKMSNSEFSDEDFAKQDTSINLWQLNNYLENNNFSDKKNIKKLVCQHRANSFILQYKASLSNGCFETDIIYLKDRTISAHKIESDKKLIFDNFLKSNYQKNTVWLDSKNINLVKNCKFALKWFEKNAKNFLSLLVETPSSSLKNINNQDWKNCIDKINNIENIQVGYYLPTAKLNNCSKELAKIKKKQDLECEKFFSNIFMFLEQTEIESITFDYSGYKAIKNHENFKNYKWHIWHVDSLKAFNNIMLNNNIGIVLLKNNKFTNNLN